MILSYGKIMKKCISHLVTCGPEKNKLHLKKRKMKKMKTFLQIQRVANFILTAVGETSQMCLMTIIINL